MTSVQHAGANDSFALRSPLLEAGEAGTAPPTEWLTKATLSPDGPQRRRSWRAYPIYCQIIFPLVCIVALPLLWYSQHHNIATIWIKVYAFDFEVVDVCAKKEGIWKAVKDLWNTSGPSPNSKEPMKRPWAVLLLTFCWSLCYPWFKFCICIGLWFFQCSKNDRGWQNVNRVLAVVHWFGKWSYADLYITMGLISTLGGGDGLIQPEPMFDLKVLVYGKTTLNLVLFVILIATSIFVIWYFRWSRQDPEDALKWNSDRKISLFTFTWEAREQNQALLNTFLLFAMCWLWLMGLFVPFVYRRMHLDLWEFEVLEEWSMLDMATPFKPTGLLYYVWLVTVIIIPTACIVLTAILWLVPINADAHSKLRICYSWFQMFSCPDVFLLCLWAALGQDHMLFEQTVSGGIPGIGPVLAQDLNWDLDGKMLPAVAYPLTASILLLYFRHIIGRQLRRRLESKPGLSVSSQWPEAKT